MSEQKQDSIFLSGMYLDRVHEKAPAFIITNQTIHVQKLIQWLQENKHLADSKGYIKIQGKESARTVDEKGNFKRYFQVDTYKKPEVSTQSESALPEYKDNEIKPEDIPF